MPDSTIQRKESRSPCAKTDRGGGEERPRLLVIDDDSTIREMLRVSLELNYEVVCRANGDDVVHTIEDVRPRLLLLDINIPGADGHEICSVIRDEARFRRLPILFMTVRKDDATFLKSLQSGGDALILKPFEIGPLRERLAYLLNLP